MLIGELAGERMTAQVDAHFPCQPDQDKEITVDMTKMHLFDPEGGQAL